MSDSSPIASRPVRAGRWLRTGLAAGVVWVVAWSLAEWWLMPRVAADPTVGRNVLPGDWSLPLVMMVFAVVGGLVLLRDRTHVYGWLLFGTAIVVAPREFAGLYALYTYYMVPEAGLPLTFVAAWLQDFSAWPVMAVVVLLLPSLFPDGRVVPGRWGTSLRVALGSWIAWGIAYMLAPRPLENWFLDLPNPPANPTGILELPIDLLTGWWLVTMVASAVISLGSIVVRWRGADADLRQQMKWPLLAFVLLGAQVLADMANTALVEGVGVDLGVTGLLQVTNAGIALAFAISLGLGVLRYRLYDVDRAISRTMVYVLLTLGVFATYLLVVVGVGSLVPDASGRGLALGATGLVAVAFEPVRRRLQAIVNRLLFGQRDEPYAVLARLGDTMTEAGTPSETLQTVVDTVGTSLKLPWVAIELDQRDGQVVRAEHGSRADGTEPVSLPLVHADVEVGRLRAAARSAGAPLAKADRRILEDVAHQAGAVAATTRLTTDLQHSREKLVLAREEERRRIRRDLHDGLGPSLAAQTLALDAAIDRLADDPEVARELLESLKTNTQELVVDIRKLVHDLRPPALDELGLAGALVAHVAQIDGSGNVAMRIRTEPDPLPELSAAVEVAAWRITCEALTNVVRHAEASRCTITLTARDEVLEVEVVDDGVGLPVVLRAGVGLQSMHDRAEELGGTFMATDAPGGGTVVQASLPITAGADDQPAGRASDARTEHHGR